VGKERRSKEMDLKQLFERRGNKKQAGF